MSSDPQPESTVYQDPRRPLPLDGGRNRVYVLSAPDPELAKVWGTKLGIPERKWDPIFQRLQVEDPYLAQAWALPKAPRTLLDERADAAKTRASLRTKW